MFSSHNRPETLDSDRPPTSTPIADALVHVQCAYTSLGRMNTVGMLARERPFFARACAAISKAVVMVGYGDGADARLAAAIRPEGWAGRFSCVCNDEGREPGRFQAGVPERVLAHLRAAGCASALVVTDQHYGGEVAVQTAGALRSAGMRVGLVARCGYHWSWTVARDTAPDDPRATAAALMEGDLCRSADAVIATTRRIAADLAWQHRLASEKVSVVPNFVLPPGEAPAFADREMGSVLFAGRLEAEKRLDLLVKAMAIVGREAAGARLTIVGDGSLGESLRRLAKELGAPVEFRARLAHEELLRAMGRCNVYAQVSRFEGHPKTILEALAMGAPCVVTRAPGVDEEIVPRQTGMVCGEEPWQIAAEIVELLRRPEEAARIGAAAAADVRSRLTIDAVFPAMLGVWRGAMATAGSMAAPVCLPVRWEQTLLNVGPDAAAAQFASSVGAFAKRLDPARREMFLDGLAARLGSIGEMGRAAAMELPGAEASRR